MRIKAKILCALLSTSLLVALVGALAVNRQRACALVTVTKEAENVARVLSFLASGSPKLPLSAVQQIVAALHQRQGRDVVIVDPGQRILADAMPASIGKIYDGDPLDEVGQTIRDGRVRTFAEHRAGIRQVVVPVEAADGRAQGAVVLEYTPLYDELMRLASGTIRQVFLACVASAAIASLLAFYICRSITGPLLQLTGAAQRFATGETNLPLPLARRDEVGGLARAFHDMVQRRRLAEDELRRTRDAFEARVMERTAELGEANAFLRKEVAERRAAEEAVKASEQRFRQIAENIREVFYMTSADGRELLYVSPAYEQIWGRNRASLYEHPQEWFEAIAPEDRAAAEAGLARLARGESFETEFRILRPDKTQRWISSRGFPVHDDAGELFRVVGVAADITERKQMEMKLLEAGKLETVGRLAGGIAHDFNTILTAIIGHAELIRQAVPAGGAEFQSATQIGKSSARAAQLTQQLLAFSRKQMLQPKEVDLNAEVAGSELILRRLLGDGIEVRVAINAKRPWAKADAGQVQQMLVQLALNAQDAMPRGGRLTLETGDATLDETYASTRPDAAAGEYVMIAITDTGGGIAEEVRPRVFEPFFTTKPQGEGTGLGLPMCYGIAKQLGGHIAIYSELGRGTTFKVYLPRAVETPPEQASEPRAGRAASSEVHGTETILIVEDDEALRDLATIVLEKLGYRVYQGASGPEALRIAAGLTRLDLLLTDVVMPQMSGKELAEQLESSRPGMKILFTSAYTEDAIVHHGILEAGIDFLHKPYTPSALARKAREILDGRASGMQPC